MSSGKPPATAARTISSSVTWSSGRRSPVRADALVCQAGTQGCRDHEAAATLARATAYGLTMDAAVGNPNAYVQAKAGHSQFSITERYVHAAQVAFPRAMDRAEARMFGSNELRRVPEVRQIDDLDEGPSVVR
jgi:hypothetical protein